MAQARYVIIDAGGVIPEVAARSSQALTDLAALLDLLVISATSALARVVVVPGSTAYRARFDGAWLVYSVHRPVWGGLPRLRLRTVRWD